MFCRHDRGTTDGIFLFNMGTRLGPADKSCRYGAEVSNGHQCRAGQGKWCVGSVRQVGDVRGRCSE